MNEQIYERFAAIVKERYPAEEAMKITGMLYVAMQETLGGDIPLNEDFSDFDKDAQTALWTEAFKICNSYGDALSYLRSAELEQEDIEEGIKQVDKAQKDELFANFLLVARANPKPTARPQFIGDVKKPEFMNKTFKERSVQIEISEKDTLSMKLHLERYMKYIIGFKLTPTGNYTHEFLRKYVSVHKVTEIPNYREFWIYRTDSPNGETSTFLFGEYMDAVGHTSDDVFVRQYLFETRMTLDNREELLKELRSTSPN